MLQTALFIDIYRQYHSLNLTLIDGKIN